MKAETIATFRELKKARKRIYSQSGEEGVLEYVLSKLRTSNQWCVEFGAWDGIHLSNTHWFIATKGFRAVLIEGLRDRYQVLCKNMQPYQVTCINAMVSHEGPSTLDVLLSQTPIPRDFDLLSIDIDGDDYFIWKSLENYNPKVVIVEINMRDKPGVVRVNRPGSAFEWGVSGSSIHSMTDLATQKGYRLVTHVGCNAIYVRNDFYDRFFSEPITARDLFTYEGHEIDELTADELTSAKFWGMRKVKGLAAYIPRPLRPIIKRLYGTLSGR